MPLFKKRDSGWVRSGHNDPVLGVSRLKQEWKNVRENWLRNLLVFFPRAGGGISGRLITFAEVLAELSSTVPGRVITATLCLAVAWRLLR